MTKSKPKDRISKAEDGLFAYLRVLFDDKDVASVAPSSRFLVERVVKAMDVRRAESVIEYGPAQGVVTRRILQALPSGARLLAVERNETFFESLRQIPDDRLLACHGDVRKVDAIASRYGIGEADVVVSGIPFSYLPVEARHELLAKTVRLLKPGGRFVAYQITAHLLGVLRDYFPKVKTQFEIRNLPPNFIFTAYK